MHSVRKHDCLVLYREHSSVRRKLVYREKYRSHNHHQHPMVLVKGQLCSRQSWTCAQDLPVLEICYEQSLIPSVVQATEWHAEGMKSCWEYCAANQVALYDFCARSRAAHAWRFVDLHCQFFLPATNFLISKTSISCENVTI